MEKLYYTQPGAGAFTARVLECRPEGAAWAVRLDRTAFFPGGGGQDCDLGTLGGAAVLGMKEAEDQVWHLCAAPLEEGMEVRGVLDFARRRELSQQHSGEHIVSGLVYRQFGYHNVGFHMGAQCMTVDFDGPISWEALTDIERRANEAVLEDVPVRTWFPDPEELASLPYRSKKALSGPVRLVEFPGYDLCACCGTHVERTGQIGPIKLLSCVKFHRGVRVELLCGSRAMAYLSAVWEQNRLVSQAFSAKMLETGAAARRMNDTLEAQKRRAGALESRVFAALAEKTAGQGDTLIFEPELTSDGVRRLADAIGRACGGTALVLSGQDGKGYQYALCRPGGDLRELNRAMTHALDGRGGGKPEFQQGSLRAGRREIEQFWNTKDL